MIDDFFQSMVQQLIPRAFCNKQAIVFRILPLLQFSIIFILRMKQNSFIF